MRTRPLLVLASLRNVVLCLAVTASAAAAPIVIRAARVIDGAGNVVPNAAVVVDGTKIVRIDPHPQRADIDLGDRTLMPGGIDTLIELLQR